MQKSMKIEMVVVGSMLLLLSVIALLTQDLRRAFLLGMAGMFLYSRYKRRLPNWLEVTLLIGVGVLGLAHLVTLAAG